MLAHFFYRSGIMQKLIFFEGEFFHHVIDPHLPFCEGSGLVKYHRVNSSRNLESGGIFIEDAKSCTKSRAYHNGNGRGKSEGAGTAYNEDGNGVRESRLEAGFHKQMHRQSYERNEQHRGNENARNLVCYFRDGRLG